jgi:tetratricopeptide (TPR) repeat protein
LIVFGLILIVFVFFYLQKNTSIETDDIVEKKEISKDDKKQIDNFWSHYRKANNFRIAGDWEPAVYEYKQALAIDPFHDNSLYHIGNMFLELEQYDSAEWYWMLQLKENPRSARAHFQLGNLHFNYQNRDYYDLEVAKKEFETTFDINKDFLQPALQLGHIALIENDVSKAIENYQKVIGSNINNVEAHFILGYSYYKKKDVGKAFIAFENAVNFSISNGEPVMASSEGDTRDGKSFQRNINKSPFYDLVEELSEVDTTKLENEMKNMYRKLDIFIPTMNPETSTE